MCKLKFAQEPHLMRLERHGPTRIVLHQQSPGLINPGKQTGTPDPVQIKGHASCAAPEFINARLQCAETGLGHHVHRPF